MALPIDLTTQTTARAEDVMDNLEYLETQASTNDGAAVHKTGNETIAGVKTFSNELVLSDIAEPGATGNKIYSVAAGVLKWAGKRIAIIANTLGNSQVVETNGSGDLISVAKGTAYNKNFGAAAGDVCQGNDARLSDARTPSNDAALVHLAGTETITGNKTFSGSVNLSALTASQVLETDASKNIVSLAKGAAYNKNFGSAAGTVCEGNDARLSDARTPTPHTHGAGDINAGTLANARLGSDVMKTTSAATATTPGTVVRKIEVFDAAGASLGFIAVYDSIT